MCNAMVTLIIIPISVNKLLSRPINKFMHFENDMLNVRNEKNKQISMIKTGTFLCETCSCFPSVAFIIHHVFTLS